MASKCGLLLNILQHLSNFLSDTEENHEDILLNSQW